MAGVSVIIPNRNSPFTTRTIQDILEKAQGEIEIVVNVDENWPDPVLDDKRVTYIHPGSTRGMRWGINAAVALAKGKYIMKLDDHCMVDVGFDVKLAADCDDNWVVIPRRKRLDADLWAIQDVGKPDVDYMYLSYPNNPRDFGGPGLHGRIWEQKNRDKALQEKLIDDVMTCQGSGWFMNRDYFYKLELMDEANYGQFTGEAQEITLKSWLSGGRTVVNKKTWYAHLHKGKKHGRGYHLNTKWLDQGTKFTNNWTNDSAWKKQTIPFSWLVEKFWPVPEWPENWKELINAK